MLAVVEKVLKRGRDDVAALQQRIAALKAEAAAAVAEIEKIEGERTLADSYEAAGQLDERCRRLRWTIEHAAALLPDLEARLARATAEKRQTALARHRAIAAEAYRKLRGAVIEAGRLQGEAMRLRNDAIAELGEGLVSVELPVVAFRGMLVPDLIQLYLDQNDRVFAPPQRQPKPVAVVQKPAAQKPPVVQIPPAAVAPRRAARKPRRDAAPAEGEKLVSILRPGVEVGGGQCQIGDVVKLPLEEATRLVASGAADFVNGEEG